MAFSTYSDLQSSIADWLHRSDLTAQIADFISLAEADMQVRAKLSQWDTEAPVVVTAGVGPLPSDFAHAISVRYGTQSGVLQYLSGEQFDGYAAANASGEPLFFTVRGTNLVLAPSATGTATLKYTARFTPLSISATTNSLLTLFPDAYLHGALAHAYSFLQNPQKVAEHMSLFEAAIRRIRNYMLDYKYPHGLQMRAA